MFITRLFFLLILCFFSLSAVAKASMTLVYYEDFPPYSFRDQQGNMTGILIDIADQVLQTRMGVELIHRGYPWERAQRMVQQGQADAFITIATANRLLYTDASTEAVIVGPMNLFVSPNNGKLAQIKNAQTMDDLSPFLILDYQGNHWGNQHFPEKKFQRFLTSNLSNALIMLAHGRGDVVVTDKIVADYLMAQLNLQEKILQLPIQLTEVKFSLCISNTSSFHHLLAEFNQQMALFREQGNIDTVLENYR